MRLVEQFRKAVQGESTLRPLSWGHRGLLCGEPGPSQCEDREGKGEKLVSLAQESTPVMRCRYDKGKP